MHIHAESEEINIVLAGAGTLVSEGEQRAFETGEMDVDPDAGRSTSTEHRQGATSTRLDLHAAGRLAVLLILSRRAPCRGVPSSAARSPEATRAG